MSDDLDNLKKHGTVATRAQQEVHKLDMKGMDIELDKGSETERETGSKRPPMGAR